MVAMNVYQQLVKAYRVGCPLVSIESVDPVATNRGIVEAVKAIADTVNVIAWDCVRGWYTHSGETDSGSLKDPTGYAGNPLELLIDAAKLDPSLRIVIIVHNAHQFLDQFTVVQAISNLRDTFKATRKMLVLLTDGTPMPAELQHDVIAMVEPLPDREQLSGVIAGVCTDAGIPASDDFKKAAGNAALGVTEFAAENLAAMSIEKKTISLHGLWESKRKKINETPALQVVSGGAGMDKIGGIPQFKKFIKQVLAGKGGINAIVFIDEIEKALGGAAGDTSGTSQDQVGTLLSWMQDHEATGCILVGPPGVVKSEAAKSAGHDFDIPTIQLDLGAAKGSLVGESERKIRQALKVVNAVSGGKTLWVATCNSLAALPPELKRRFKLGTWFFDLPTLEERKVIWAIYQAKYDLKPAQVSGLFKEEWTGAEIKQCCELAWQLSIEPKEAAEYVVPVSKQGAEMIERLRAGAENRLLSASAPGTYTRSKPAEVTAQATKGRKFE